MTYLILAFLLWLSDNRSVERVSQKNMARREAHRAYQSGNFSRAANQYEILIKSSLFAEPSARLNLAHSYFQLRQFGLAKRYYGQVTHVRQTELAATALHQLGVIACLQGDSAAALRFYRQALEKQPDLVSAQFNYELISKRFSGRTLPTQRTKRVARKPTQSSASGADLQAGTPNTGREVEQNDRRTDLLRRLRSLNLTETQVLQLLNSLQDDEVQYIQQRKPAASSGIRARNAYRTW